VFLRKSVADLEAAEARRNAQDLRSQLLAFVLQPGDRNTGVPSGDTLKALRGLLAEIENMPKLGRVSVVADPKLVAGNPERNLTLEPGDRIVIPRKPATVTVLGEVMRPGNFTSDDSMSVHGYLDEAGGLTQFADSSRVIVVLPDGKVRQGVNSWLSFGYDRDIPVGSTIVVPRDLNTLTMHQLIVDTTQIFSQLATTAAALAVLSKY
jgi:polysaccharide biosynthesis/export protein